MIAHPRLGKTILASVVIDEIMKCRSASVAFFYCKHKNTSGNTFITVARAILAQLLRQNEDLLPFLYERQASSMEVVLESPRILAEILEVVCRSMEKAFIVVDGLDECEEDERKKILSWLKPTVESTHKENPGCLRALFTSRDEGDIKRLLSKVTMKRVEGQDNYRDIQSYADAWSLRIQRKFGLSDLGKVEISLKVSRKAQGTV